MTGRAGCRPYEEQSKAVMTTLKQYKKDENPLLLTRTAPRPCKASADIYTYKKGCEDKAPSGGELLPAFAIRRQRDMVFTPPPVWESTTLSLMSTTVLPWKRLCRESARGTNFVALCTPIPVCS